MKNSKKVSKKSQIDKTNEETFFSYIYRIFLFLTCWNILFLGYSIIQTLSGKDLAKFPNSYGDYFRGDLFLVLVQGDFDNPYQYNPEIPSLTNQPYLPGLYLLLHLFRFKLYAAEKNLIWVHLIVVGMIGLIVVIFWQILGKIPIRIKLSATLSLSIFSVPAIYLFTTGNIQALIVATCLLTVLFLHKFSKKIVAADFLGSLFITTTKPQFLLINLYAILVNNKKRTPILSGIFVGSLISLFGLWYFGNSLSNNLNYWLGSLRGFVTANPAYVVHNNASLIGNLSAIELWLSPSRIDELFSIRFTKVIALATIFTLLYILYRLHKRQNVVWLKLWLIASISTLVTPVSFNYNLVLFLVPVAVLIGNKSERSKFIETFMQFRLYRFLFGLMLFLTFASKPWRVWLVRDVADTNLFNMMSAFSIIGAIILTSKILKTSETK